MKLIFPSTVVLALLAAVPGCQRLDAAPEDEAISRGRAHVEQVCVTCHPGPQLDALVGRRLDPQKPASLDSFLTTHHAADPALRADVIAYLQTRLAIAPPGS